MDDPRLRAIAEQTLNLAIGPRHPPLYSEQVVFNIVDLCNIHVAANETKTWFDQHKGTDDAFLVGLYALRPEGPLSAGASDRGCQFPFQIGRNQYTNGWILASQRLLERIVAREFWPKPPAPKDLSASGIHQFMTRIRQVMRMLLPGTDGFIRIQIIVDMIEFISSPNYAAIHKFVRAAAVFQLLSLDSTVPVTAVNIMLANLYLEAREYSDNRFKIAAALDSMHEDKCTNALVQMTWQKSVESPDKLVSAIMQSLYRTIEEARIDIAERRGPRQLPQFSSNNPIRHLYHTSGTFAFKEATVSDTTECLRQACIAKKIPLNILNV